MTLETSSLLVDPSQIRQSTQNRKSQLENVNIDWNLSQDEAGSIDLSDEDMTVVDNANTVQTTSSVYSFLYTLLTSSSFS